jgi:hypothetical protein
MSLGDHVRVVRTFLDAFRDTENSPSGSETITTKDNPELHATLVDLRRDLKVRNYQLPRSLQKIIRCFRHTRMNLSAGALKMIASEDHFTASPSYLEYLSVSSGSSACSPFPSQDFSCGSRSSPQLSTPSTISKRVVPFGTRGMN